PHQRHLQYLRRTRRWDARLQSANRRTLGHRGGNGYRLVRRQGQRAAGLVRADLRHAEQLARHGSPALRICFRHGHALCDDGRAVRNGLRQQSRLDRGARHRSRGLGSVDGEAGIPLRRPQRLQLQRGLRRRPHLLQCQGERRPRRAQLPDLAEVTTRGTEMARRVAWRRMTSGREPFCRRAHSAAWVCRPAYSRSVSVCSAGSTSRANRRMFLSVRSRGSVANCSIARKFWNPSRWWLSTSCLRTLSGLPHRMMPCSMSVSMVCSWPVTERLWLSIFFKDLALR